MFLKKWITQKKQKYVTHKKKNSNTKIEFSKSLEVRDSSHFTGRSMYAACRFCYLIKPVRQEIPMVMHNGLPFYYKTTGKFKSNNFHC